MIAASSAPSALGVAEVFLRLLCAMAVGTVVGMERESSNRPAGLRTHILVALGACSVMLTSQMIFAQYSFFGALPDPARLPAQVITGVGFLGAGTILKEGPTVHGLTTAASLWTVACLGVASGAGYYSIALIGVIFIFLTLTVLEFLQQRIVGQDSVLHYFIIDTENIVDALEALNRHAKRQNAGLCEMKTQRSEDGKFQILFRAEIGGLHSKARRRHFLEGLAAESAITAIHLSRKNEEAAT